MRFFVISSTDGGAKRWLKKDVEVGTGNTGTGEPKLP